MTKNSLIGHYYETVLLEIHFSKNAGGYYSFSLLTDNIDFYHIIIIQLFSINLTIYESFITC
jgi:hypothetical protein